ncbi:hypothetical protein EMIT0133MI5_20815 [Bacillus velezensis]
MVFLHNREFLGKNIKAGKSYSKSYYPKQTKLIQSGIGVDSIFTMCFR